MLTSRLLPLAAMALFSIAASAQEAPSRAAAPDPGPAAAAAMPANCPVRQPIRHDHGAEKGTPTPMMSGCPMAAEAASAAPATSKAKSKARLNHDHAKFHKLM